MRLGPSDGRVNEGDESEALARDLMQVLEGILYLPPETVVRRIVDDDGYHPVFIKGVSYARLLFTEKSQLLECGQRITHGACLDVFRKYNDFGGYSSCSILLYESSMKKMTIDVMKEKTPGIDGQNEANRSLDIQRKYPSRALKY